jgi:hypothetical protein
MFQFRDLTNGRGTHRMYNSVCYFSNNVEADDLPNITDEIEEENKNIDDDANRPISISGEETRFM